MKVSYKREMRHNYMILEALEEGPESYEIKMLTENTIEGLLRFRVKQEEQGKYYYYEITSKQPLSRLLEFKEIRKEELSKLILGVGVALDHMEDHLLQESDLLLEPEYIYIEPESYKVWLCYVPGYHGDLPAAMGKLLQFLLKKADHKDNATVVLAYRLYQESQKDYYGIGDLLRAVRESRGGEGPEYAHGDGQRYARGDGPRYVRGDSPGYKREGDRKDLPWEPGSAEGPADPAVPALKRPETSGKGELLKREIDDAFWPGEGSGEEPFYVKNRKNSRQRTMFVVMSILSILIAVPAVVWLFAGPAGVSRYRSYIAAAEVAIAAAALLLFHGIRSRGTPLAGVSEGKKKGGLRPKNEPEERQERWYMCFSEDEEEEGEEIEGGVKDTGSPEPAPDSPGMEGMGGNGTVLLAEAAASEEKAHLLKSLDPSVEDIPILYFPFILGKQEGIVDYIVKRDTVSRLHLRFDEEGGACRVTDLNSSNGTVVAGYDLEANESYPINSGDKIQIADLSFVFY